LKYEKLQREHDELDYEYRKLANDHQKLQYQYLSLEKAFNAKTAETCLFDTGVTTEKDFSESSFWFNPKESPTMDEMQQYQRF
jgi:hypothetical protein